MTRHVVGAVGDFPPGSHKLIEVNGRAIVVFNLDGEFFALLDRCPHQGGKLSRGVRTGVVLSTAPGHYQGVRKGELIRCPWHGWQFDIKTGQSWCAPDQIKTMSYDVSRSSGAALVQGPFVAETVVVEVDQDYVVIDA